MILPKDEFSTGFRYPGNIRWVPPEAFGFRDEEDEEEGDQKPTKAWDVYSYGCIVFQVCRIVNVRKQPSYSSLRSSREISPMHGYNMISMS
jgi:hypothetical protein